MQICLFRKKYIDGHCFRLGRTIWPMLEAIWASPRSIGRCARFPPWQKPSDSVLFSLVDGNVMPCMWSAWLLSAVNRSLSLSVFVNAGHFFFKHALVAAGRVVAHMGYELREAHLTLHGSAWMRTEVLLNRLQLACMHVRMHSFAPVFPPRPDSKNCRPD